jgi:CheY-like chemotaxis protein
MNQVVLLSERSEQALRSGPPAILVVDDEELLRSVLQLVLRREGFQVFAAANGHEALKEFRQHRDAIDMVLLDVRMPGLNGPGTLTALKALAPEVRCCFMSGDMGGGRPEDLLALGAERVFAKPFPLAETARVLWAMVS